MGNKKTRGIGRERIWGTAGRGQARSSTGYGVGVEGSGTGGQGKYGSRWRPYLFRLALGDHAVGVAAGNAARRAHVDAVPAGIVGVEFGRAADFAQRVALDRQVDGCGDEREARGVSTK